MNSLIISKELSFFLFLFLFGETHFASTFLFYLNSKNFNYIKSKFYALIAIPIIIVLIYIIIGIVDFETAIILGAIGSGIHVTRQSIGIQRLYGFTRNIFFENITYIASFGFIFVGFCRFYLENIIERLNIKRSKIPAVTHIDYSARVQTVHKETNLKYYKLLSEFKKKTGCPVLVNTSFNVRGEPIVNTPEDAFNCFMGTELDVLAIGNCYLNKENQIKSFEITSEKSYINRRSLIKSLGILSATPFFSNTFAENDTPNQKPLDFIKNNQYSTTEPVNSFEDITTYNNYYVRSWIKN